MNKMIATALIGAASLAASPSQAGVVLTSQAFGLDDVPANSAVIDFEGAMPVGFQLIGGEIRNYSDGRGAEPAQAEGVRESSNYLAVNADSPALLTSTTGYRAVSLMWGSIDDYNSVTLLDQLGDTIQSFTGSDVVIPANGDQGAGATNRRVTFTTNGDTSAIYGVSFKSGSPAFEMDNIAFSGAVPEPATWAMLIVGFAAVGGTMRRRTPVLQTC